MQRAAREHSRLSHAQEGLESRIHRKVSVRFGGGVTETWPGNRKRRRVPTLRFDGGKKIKGRKRHLLVDTTGMILHVLVHEATIQDHIGGRLLLAPLRGCLPRLQLIWADSAYKKGGFSEWVKESLGWDVEIVEHPWSGLRGVWARHPMR